MEILTKDVTKFEEKDITNFHGASDLDAETVEIEPIIVFRKPVEERFFELGESKICFELEMDFVGAMGIGTD